MSASALHAQGKCTSSEKDGILVVVVGGEAGVTYYFPKSFPPPFPYLSSPISTPLPLQGFPSSRNTSFTPEYTKKKGLPTDPIGNEDPQLQKEALRTQKLKGARFP